MSAVDFFSPVGPLPPPLSSERDSACWIAICRRALFVGACCCGLSVTGTAFSAERSNGEPGWLPVVVAPPQLREQLDATPIEERPYRPLHFYGNTVRRIHYRGTAMPRVREVIALPARVVVRPSLE